jgi:hypothetical protein
LENLCLYGTLAPEAREETKVTVSGCRISLFQNTKELDALQSRIAAHEQGERRYKEDATRRAEQKRRREKMARIKRFRSGDPRFTQVVM